MPVEALRVTVPSSTMVGRLTQQLEAELAKAGLTGWCLGSKTGGTEVTLSFEHNTTAVSANYVAARRIFENVTPVYASPAK